ncbi:MAG: hypothetical protein U0736_05080 [Gemmataceae bacterium]
MRTMLFAGVLLAGLGSAVAAEEKGTAVDLDGLTSTAPAAWVKESPSNRMRYLQFRLPKVKGDTEDAELVIFKGLGGSADDNIVRWKRQFTPPGGKVTQIKIGGHQAALLDADGTYGFNPAPFNPASKTIARPNYRMLAVHFDGPKDVYHIKLTGPAKTVAHYKKGFDTWLEGFKK